MNPFNLCLHLFQLIVLFLVTHLHLCYLCLHLLLLLSLDDLPTILVNKSPHCVLLAQLLNSIGQLFDLVTTPSDLVAKFLTPLEFLLKKLPIFVHSLITTIRPSEEIEGTSAVG